MPAPSGHPALFSSARADCPGTESSVNFFRRIDQLVLAPFLCLLGKTKACVFAKAAEIKPY